MSEMQLGEYKTKLVTTVGSCIAVCMYNGKDKVGGMAHIVLPFNKASRVDSIFKYAKTGVPALLEALKEKGAVKIFTTAKIAGGANMFPLLNYDTLNIGKENIAEVKKMLADIGIRLVAEDVGGTKGRKVEFDVSNGEVIVETLSGGVVVL